MNTSRVEYFVEMLIEYLLDVIAVILLKIEKRQAAVLLFGG